MGGTLPKAALLLWIFSLALVACSKEPPGEPDRAETRAAPRGTLAEGAGASIGVSGEAPRQPTIEGARLQTGEEGEKIIVVVGHEVYFPDCFLMEARAVRGAGRGDVYGRKAESRWPKEGATETVQTGGSFVVVFHGDLHPGARVADPRKTPYSVLCVEAVAMRAGEAHVEGTPKASH